jgi:hypothetical protein
MADALKNVLLPGAGAPPRRRPRPSPPRPSRSAPSSATPPAGSTPSSSSTAASTSSAPSRSTSRVVPRGGRHPRPLARPRARRRRAPRAGMAPFFYYPHTVSSPNAASITSTSPCARSTSSPAASAARGASGLPRPTPRAHPRRLAELDARCERARPAAGVRGDAPSLALGAARRLARRPPRAGAGAPRPAQRRPVDDGAAQRRQQPERPGARSTLPSSSAPAPHGSTVRARSGGPSSSTRCAAR